MSLDKRLGLLVLYLPVLSKMTGKAAVLRVSPPVPEVSGSGLSLGHSELRLWLPRRRALLREWTRVSGHWSHQILLMRPKPRPDVPVRLILAAWVASTSGAFP